MPFDTKCSAVAHITPSLRSSRNIAQIKPSRKRACTHNSWRRPRLNHTLHTKPKTRHSADVHTTRHSAALPRCRQHTQPFSNHHPSPTPHSHAFHTAYKVHQQSCSRPLATSTATPASSRRLARAPFTTPHTRSFAAELSRKVAVREERGCHQRPAVQQSRDPQRTRLHPHARPPDVDAVLVLRDRCVCHEMNVRGKLHGD